MTSRKRLVCLVLSGLGALSGAFCWQARGQQRRADDGPKLGIGADLGGRRLFPANNPWNQDVSGLPADPRSDALIASIGRDKPLHPDFGTTYNGAPNGIPYVVVPGTQPRVPVRFEYADESDPGPYPVPPDAPIEGGPAGKGDRHILILDRDRWKLYELFSAYPEGRGWRAGSGAIFDLNSNDLRPAGWTSADAAGLPVLPGLVRYDEVHGRKAIRHALRFTVTRSRRGYVHPARHFASSRTDPDLPPMGMRVRLKAGYDISGFPPPARVILTALKRYGMIVADNGGDWFVSGSPDPRWNDEDLATLKRVKGRDFEVVKMGEVVTK
uniref:Outermembrane protein n=1 Tax=uncultured Armatimonadetes bacterium TaxID=157466 RepID=A0A6J4HUF2_9BACT|nr:outermembrane protein [uncultured Armatimonadetes bacterium]